MKTKAGHLTYCTNIHPGLSWTEHFREIKSYLPDVKSALQPNAPMGVGLRLSKQMQSDLSSESRLDEFRSWLEKNDLYVFTVNGFPYGTFHGDTVKDKVHHPDWTTADRLEYTTGLFDILAHLLPQEIKGGGISTSPLSYRHWFPDPGSLSQAKEKATFHIVKVAEHLWNIKENRELILHLDLEPEPDGIIEDGKEFTDWYEEYLIPEAIRYFGQKGFSQEATENLIREHIRLCYDVCHMAVGFEDQRKLISRLENKNIKIGKIQLSSALKVLPGGSPQKLLKAFVEDRYLHQVVIKTSMDEYLRFKDLDEALLHESDSGEEWRIHFHVPIFTRSYEGLHSTQDYIDEILEIHHETPLTDQFEIETYTWEVLPGKLQLPLTESIIREFEYILNKIK